MTSGLFRPQDERFRADVRRFVDDALRPQAGALEKAQIFPRRAIALCARSARFDRSAQERRAGRRDAAL
jgi:hypothetical protein